MNELKTNLSRLNIPEYTTNIIECISNSDPVSKYLLFTQLSVYMGMSLPTSALLYFVVYYLSEKDKREKERMELQPKSLYDSWFNN